MEKKKEHYYQTIRAFTGAVDVVRKTGRKVNRNAQT